MQEVIVETQGVPLSSKGQDWEKQIQQWKDGMSQWKNENRTTQVVAEKKKVIIEEEEDDIWLKSNLSKDKVSYEKPLSPCREKKIHERPLSPCALKKIYEKPVSPCAQKKIYERPLSPCALAKLQDKYPNPGYRERPLSPREKPLSPCALKKLHERPLSPREKPLSPCAQKKIYERPLSPCALKKQQHYKHVALKDDLCVSERGTYYKDRNHDGFYENIPKTCLGKPYLNLAEALILDDQIMESVEVLTSPSAVFLDVEKVVEHFPNLKAAYNIFIKVYEHNAYLLRELDLVYALFVLDPLAPELTLTELLPHLNHDGYFAFFYGKGMISINRDVMIVKDTEIPENLLKLVRYPGEYPCKEGSWYTGTWKVYAVGLTPSQCKCLEKVSSDGVIKLEHVKIKNEGNMFYGDWHLRQFVESLVLSLHSAQLPVFVLSGLGSVPLIETIIYVYAEQNGLVTDDRKVRVDCLLQAWIGDNVTDKTLSMAQIREIILRHRGNATHFHKLLLQDPLLVKLIREEQELFAFGKPFSHNSPYHPELLE
ncbi:Hypothetical protein BQ3484_222 [Cedratvirus A11]|uniref:Uncharacterized protein n=1 Tax=Cedratvirus A11 TaxID=1903266 RepID=A0A1M7XUN9_9VIRU|nr:Hypothetical protein BQ3484_222 [Cedratvirus A11]SHO33290.1 Hypothetical protein BQ3484_222 [Cedratvirus A11]